MTVLLHLAAAAVAYGLAVAIVFRGFPAAATAFRWALRRVLGARPKPPRHAGGAR